MGIRNYNNTSVPQTILNAGGIDNSPSTTGITVGDNSSYPAVPFTLGIERGTTNQEVVECTAKSGSTGFIVSRGFNGSPTLEHPEGASIELTSAAIDFAEANALVNTLQEKGDILAFSTETNNLPVGPDGTALTADSTQSFGLGWVQPVPSGVVAYTASSTAPTGWVIANGQSLSRSIHANLFGVLGTTYGAADGSHFNVPDLRQCTVRGVGSGYSLATTGGADETSVTLGTAQLPSHSHSNTVLVGGTPVTTEVVVYDPGSTIHAEISGSGFGVSYTVTPSIEVTINSTGSGDAFEVGIVNKYIALTPIIKL